MFESFVSATFLQSTKDSAASNSSDEVDEILARLGDEDESTEASDSRLFIFFFPCFFPFLEVAAGQSPGKTPRKNPALRFVGKTSSHSSHSSHWMKLTASSGGRLDLKAPKEQIPSGTVTECPRKCSLGRKGDEITMRLIAMISVRP